MTADERIEKLVGAFGQTISDLPKPQTVDYAYTREHLGKAIVEATEWHGRFNSGSLDCEDYICHLADVIDRMEAALDTARRLMPCVLCENCADCSKGIVADGLSIRDMYLLGIDFIRHRCERLESRPEHDNK